MTTNSHNRFIEIQILEEAIKILGETSFTDIQRLDPPQPDFRCLWQSSLAAQIPLFIEITQILPADPRTNSNNATIERYCQDLREILENNLTSYGHLAITVTLSHLPSPNPARRAQELQDLAQIIQSNMSQPTSYLWSANLPSQLNYVDWIHITHSNSPRTIPRIVVMPNLQYIEPQHLEQRIIDTIIDKESKNYRSVIGNEELWLIIRLNDGITSPTDLETLNPPHTSTIFNRVYLQLDFWPPTDNYPLKQIQ